LFAATQFVHQHTDGGLATKYQEINLVHFGNKKHWTLYN